MITFKQYLNEAGSPRTVPISAKSAFEIIDKDCSAFARTMNKQQIYRGGSGGSIWERTYYGNSNSGDPRKSANTANYFTLWHDNHPDWAAFPKRSRSFICSTAFDGAEAFGDVHIIVPRDNAHIGIVPDEDLFGAITSPDGEYLNELNNIISAVLDAVRSEYKMSDKYVNTYKELVECLKLATPEVLERHKGAKIREAIGHLDQYDAKTYYAVVQRCYNPKDFKEGKASSIALPKGTFELYIQGEAVFLPYAFRANERARLPDDYIELLQLAVGKYNWDIDA